jgi:hypothetical protein
MSESNTDVPFELWNERAYPDVHLNERDATVLAEDMLKAGAKPEQVNAKLRELGYREVNVSPAAQATRELARLKESVEWQTRLANGDLAAEADFQRLTLAISQGGGAPESAVKPEDYRLPSHHPVLRNAEPEDAQRFDTDTRTWAAELQIRPNVAAAIAEYALDAMATRRGMSVSAQENWGREQETMFRSVLGSDADTDIGHAERWLNAQSEGRKFDLKAIAREYGASVANEMYLHAAWLAETSE